MYRTTQEAGVTTNCWLYIKPEHKCSILLLEVTETMNGNWPTVAWLHWCRLGTVIGISGMKTDGGPPFVSIHEVNEYNRV